MALLVAMWLVGFAVIYLTRADLALALAGGGFAACAGGTGVFLRRRVWAERRRRAFRDP